MITMKHIFIPLPAAQGYQEADIDNMPVAPFEKVAAVPPEGNDRLLEGKNWASMYIHGCLHVLWNNVDYDNTIQIKDKDVVSVSGWTIPLSHQDIADKSGMRRAQVRDTLNKLINEGLVAKQGDNKSAKSFRYRIIFYGQGIENIQNDPLPVNWQAIMRDLNHVYFAPVVSMETV